MNLLGHDGIDFITAGSPPIGYRWVAMQATSMGPSVTAEAENSVISAPFALVSGQLIYGRFTKVDSSETVIMYREKIS